MREARQLIARHESRAPTTDMRDSARRLPEELLHEQVQRLAVLSAVVFGLWTIGLLIDLVLLPYMWSLPMSRRSVCINT